MGLLDPKPEFDSTSIARLEELANWLRDERVSLVFTSPLLRAKLTADYILGGDAVITDDRLREWGLGQWQGMRYEDVRAHYPGWFNDRDIWDATITPPGGEAFSEVESRVRSFLSDLNSDTPRAAVVTHNGIIRMMRYVLGEVGAENLFAVPETPLTPWQIEAAEWHR